jgi:hypothetical protein
MKLTRDWKNLSEIKSQATDSDHTTNTNTWVNLK